MPADPAFPNSLALPGAEGLHGILDMPGSIAIAAKSTAAAFSSGIAAPLLVYECEYQGRTLLNPLLRSRTGATVRVQFWNALAEESIIHWHGFKVDSNNDGHPHYAVPGGARYDYHYTIANRAATYWYHPHPHRLTGRQTYLGLAGLFIVEDDDESRLQHALDLKLGESDIPLLIQDKRLAGDGRPVYRPGAEDRVRGHLGAEILVNHTVRPHFQAASRIYRFRIVNGSNARIYRLAFLKAGAPLTFHLIGNDGGLLERPYSATQAFIAPAERIDALLDLRQARPGEAIHLASLPFDAMRSEMVSPMPLATTHLERTAHRAGANLEEGAAFDLMKIYVRRRTDYRRTLPDILSSIPRIDASAAPERMLRLDQVQGAWRINGLAYDVRATPIVVKRGSVEIWEVHNAARGMPHPLHVHGLQFQMLERAGSPEQQRRNALDERGLCACDRGWKDTVLVWPGETVRLALDFSHNFLGDQVYLVHCHNLEHEDGGMMLNFKIAA